MQAKKGIYALLLGSGVSRSAQIPTGWNILKDLITRVATSRMESVQNDPIDWYRQIFGADPEYGTVLDHVAKSSAERGQIIRPYIEPTEDERELGLKQPTDAHRAIASLVSRGYVRVMVTTNFDRLLETALSEVGITASVISSADGVDGTLPLAHNACTIIKINGDYVDARIKNTNEELSKYPEALSALLQQVFTEYGLIISGWSGEWDIVLGALLRTHVSRWFSTYWVSYSQPSDQAKTIVEARGAHLITNIDADHFFTQLGESVESIENMTNPELLSIDIAEASLKRYIDDPTKRIRIHDLVIGETSRVHQNLLGGTSVNYHEDISRQSIEERLNLYERGTEVLRTLLVTGCYWGGTAIGIIECLSWSDWEALKV